MHIKPKTALILNWIVSIIFAVVIIFSDTIFGAENENATLWFIAVWLIPFSFLAIAGRNK